MKICFSRYFVQLIDLTQGELEWLAKHMGHEIDIHKMAYRIHTAAVEVAKVGKVLQVMDSTAPGKQSALRQLKGIELDFFTLGNIGIRFVNTSPHFILYNLLFSAFICRCTTFGYSHSTDNNRCNIVLFICCNIIISNK